MSKAREVEVGRDLRLEVSDLLLSEADGIGAADEAARRRLLAGDRDQRPRELGRIAPLPAALPATTSAAPPCSRRSSRWTARRMSPTPAPGARCGRTPG